MSRFVVSIKSVIDADLKQEYLVRALLRSEVFHGVVRRIHGGVQGFRSESFPQLKERLRDPAAYAKRQKELKQQQQHDQQEANQPGFLTHFWDELKDQATPRPGRKR